MTPYKRGICQECGGEFSVFGDGSRVARHGFSRHHGRECEGSRKVPSHRMVRTGGGDERDRLRERIERLRGVIAISIAVLPEDGELAEKYLLAGESADRDVDLGGVA